MTARNAGRGGGSRRSPGGEGRFAPALRRIQRRHGSKAGFTLIELAVAVVIMSLLLVPLLRLAGGSVAAARLEKTEIALQTASDALIAFAAVHNGCLPFATDHEGGLPDTDLNGSATAGYVDSGDHQNADHAGDLPWAELGLTNSLLDGDGLRIQYYIATPYTDTDGDPAIGGIDCRAGFRGFEWDSSVAYVGSPSDPVYVYYDIVPVVPLPDDRRLYKITTTLAAGNRPDANVGPNVEEFKFQLPTTLLEVVRGPDVINGTAAEIAGVSAQNVFVLIATGRNRNDVKDRRFLRDSNHMGDAAGTEWTLQAVTNSVDGVVFSATRNIDDTDRGDDGDDTLLVMSFVNYKAELAEYSFNMEAICDSAC